MKNVYAILTVLILLSCAKQKKKIISTWDNGIANEVHEYTFDSDSSYIYLEYNENGQLITKGRIDSSIQNGTWKWWHDNGQLEHIAYLKNGLYIGERLHFNEKGDTTQIEIIETPCKGSCCLGYQIYFEKNKRILIHPYNELGLKHGLSIYLNKQGDTAAIFNYTNGLKFGLRTEFNKDGVVSAFGKYKNNLEDGIWILFNADENPVGYNVYEEGEIVNDEIDKAINLDFKFKKGTESKIDYYQRVNRDFYTSKD